MSGQLLTLRRFGLFSDEVFTSTDLNRRSAEVLNHARKNPVTIARNNEQFALMRREQAAYLINSLERMKDLMEIFQGALSVKLGLEPPASVGWMKALGEDDRLKMLQEIVTACSNASTVDDWDALGDLVHEWRESALVIESGVIQKAVSEPAEEITLSAPVQEEEI